MKLNGNHRGSHSADRNNRPRRPRERGKTRRSPTAQQDAENIDSQLPDELEEVFEPARRAGQTPPPSRPRTGKNAGGRKKRSPGKVIGAVCGALVALVALVIIVYSLWEEPPARNTGGLMNPVAESTEPQQSADPEASATPEPTEDPNAGAPVSHNDSMYTFLVVGFDQVADHTDTIMVGSLNTDTHEIYVYSIPRDTLMNISGGTKKINELFLRGMNSTDGDQEAKMQGGIDRLLSGITDLLGFEVDVYAAVDLEAFVKLIDAIGGVDYDVPVDMHPTGIRRRTSL